MIIQKRKHEKKMNTKYEIPGYLDYFVKLNRLKLKWQYYHQHHHF